jgi:hypothetical protein
VDQVGVFAKVSKSARASSGGVAGGETIDDGANRIRFGAGISETVPCERRRLGGRTTHGNLRTGHLG